MSGSVIAVKEHPILFSGEMVRAILDGRKTQTRRVANVRGADRVLYVDGAKLVPSREGDAGFTGWVAEVDKLGGATGLHLPLTCPYGKPGDTLWVRETWAKWENGGRGVAFKTDGAFHELLFDGQTPKEILPEVVSRLAESVIELTTWKPSIHMPRWASRLSLEVVSVRVERLQDIGGQDVKAEGVEFSGEEYRETFQQLWDSINSDRGFGWDANPFVWVIEFRKVMA